MIFEFNFRTQNNCDKILKYYCSVLERGRKDLEKEVFKILQFNFNGRESCLKITQKV